MSKYQLYEYWEDRLTKYFCLEGVGFLGLGLEYNKWLYKARLRVLSQLLHKHHIDSYGMQIFDIGVGTGFYIDFWERLGVKHITGLDISQRSISELTIKYPRHTFFRRDISGEICFEDKFHIITAFDILFHVVEEEKFEQAIRNIKKISRSDAWILISDNFLREFKPPAFHENYRTLSRYQAVLRANDLQVVDIQPIFYFGNSPVDVSAIKTKPLQLLLKASWNIISKLLYYANSKKLRKVGGAIIGFVLGWLLYHIDEILLRYIKNGVSTKLLLARVKETNDQY